MRLHYFSLHEASGYGVAAHRCMRALSTAGVELRWIPMVPGPGWGLGYEPASSGDLADSSLSGLLGGPEECDAVVCHLVPEYWPLVRTLYPDVPIVGHTVWETDRLPRHWPALVDGVDLVVVPTAWNRDVIRASGVRAPIEVVPHIAASTRVGARSPTWSEIPDTALVFYTIAPWTSRKALPATVCAYQTAFSGRDDTLLVIKSSPYDHTRPPVPVSSPAAAGTSAWALAQVLSDFARPAPVRLVIGDLPEDEIEALHARGDCYVSLCRSEGWGIPAFDAAAWGNPVVITGFGGQREYLDDGSAFLVDYELVAVDDPLGGASYTPDQHWAEPSVDHAARLLRQVVAEPAEAAARATRARARVRRDFDAEVVAVAFVDALSRL